ncbi:MAG TPA: protein phosphatase 2C domain-containing protein [Thermotogota bacterium]|nr:protein phosphatase 2C domain-containing protein [Thermotogota bacterium]
MWNIKKRKENKNLYKKKDKISIIDALFGKQKQKAENSVEKNIKSVDIACNEIERNNYLKSDLCRNDDMYGDIHELSETPIISNIFRDHGFSEIVVLESGLLWQVRKGDDYYFVLKGDREQLLKFHSINIINIPNYIEEINADLQLHLLKNSSPTQQKVPYTLGTLINNGDRIKSLKTIIQLISILSELQKSDMLLCHLHPSLIGVTERGEPVLFYPYEICKPGQISGINYNLNYSAPEMLVGNELRSNTLVYVLGAIIYRILTGKQLPEKRDFFTIEKEFNTIPYGPQILYESLQDDPNLRFSDVIAVKEPLEDYCAYVSKKELLLEYFSEVNIGRNPKRKKNQDSVGIFSNEITLNNLKSNLYFFCVADGMGGGVFGDLASKIAIQKSWVHLNLSLDNYKISDHEEINALVKDAVLKANEEIVKEKNSKAGKGESMGTTFTSLLFIDRFVYMAHVGDTRVYWYHNQVLEQLSIDHSYVQTLVGIGEISKEEARVHPNKNILTRSLGDETLTTKNIDSIERNGSLQFIELEGEGYFLLCSDGVWEGLGDSFFEKLFLQQIESPIRLNQLTHQITENALKTDGSDNISLIIIHYSSKENHIS